MRPGPMVARNSNRKLSDSETGHGNLTQFSELVTEMMMMVTVRRPLGPAGLGLARDA